MKARWIQTVQIWRLFINSWKQKTEGKTKGWRLGRKELKNEQRERKEERDPQRVDSCLVYLFMYSWSFVIHLSKAADINISTYNPYKFASCIYRAEFADSYNLSCDARMNSAVFRLNNASFPQRLDAAMLCCPVSIRNPLRYSTKSVWFTPFGLTRRLYKRAFCRVRQTRRWRSRGRIGWITADHGVQIYQVLSKHSREKCLKRGSKALSLDWVRWFRAKWIVMIFDYANFINRNKLSHILSVSSWLKQADFQPASSELFSRVMPARPVAVQFNSCQWRSLFQTSYKTHVCVCICVCVRVAFERWSCKNL